ncbi:MAG TPA: hypothetical protein VFZ64_00335 [Nocardioidaceae bacterium]
MRKTMVVVVAAIAVGLGALSAPASANRIGNEGCTPGYWKNHTNWEETTPTTLFSDLFSDGTSGWLVGVTMQEALAGGGGSGVAGAERVLARAAAAAWLNAAHEGLGYPLRRNYFVPLVVAALESGDRDAMLALAAELDALNNLGCPL